MKPAQRVKTLVPLFIVCVAGAFALGWVTRDWQIPSTPHLTEAIGATHDALAAANRRDARDGAKPDGDAQVASGSSDVLSPERARASIFQALSEPDQLVRLREVCGLLDRMTRENWREMKEAFVRQTMHTGRTHNLEWALMLYRIGQIGGIEALEWEGSAPGGAAIASGIGTAHPIEALEWIKNAPDDPRVDDMLAGVAGSNAKGAIDAVLQLSELPLQENAARAVIGAIIEKSGLTEAERLFREIPLAEDSSAARKAMFSKIVDTKIHAAGLRKDPRELLDWMGGYLGAGSPIHDDMYYRLVGKAAETNAPEALRWVDANMGRIPQEAAAFTYNAIARTAPDQMIAWREANPNHPWMDTVAECAADGLFQKGRAAEAAAWIELIPDPERKAKYVAELGKRTARK